MEELVKRLMAVANIDVPTAERVVQIELAFLKDQGNEEKVAELLRRIPGGEMVETPDEGSFGGMMGAMAALASLQSEGLDVAEVRAVTKEVIGFARQHAGAELVDDVVRSVPFLSQIV